jgi:hypothetical protein
MSFNKPNRKALIFVFFCLGLFLLVFSNSHDDIDYNTQVKPILNKSCISCHGGVKREGGFSLLFRSEALAETESGKPAIIPGDPENSEMIRRLSLDDPEERMPYKHEPLAANDIKILTQWIKQGVKWGDHWAYVSVKESKVPEPKGALWGLLPSRKPEWINNDIDYFIYEKLQQAGLKPAAEADKATLLRRVSLDLTGLPPAPALLNQFLNNKKENAYEELVDSLLASKYFGERWTSMWLDIARYADTKGYERDDSRQIWRYRDWLIDAFNQDKPYDQFLTEQLAGDLLPSPTDANFIATAFHRNTMTNDEGGTDNEEFRTSAVMDRVNTTWEGIMSTTFACVQCHSHPYDPFTHEEYYEFMAFFNNSRDEDTYDDYPLLRSYSATDSVKLDSIVQWVKLYGSEKKSKDVYTFLKTWQPAYNSNQTDQFVNSELSDTKWLAMRNHGSARLAKVNLQHKKRLVYRYGGYLPGGIWTIHLDRPNGPVLATIPVAQTNGWSISQADLPASSGVHDLYFRYVNPHLQKPDDTGIMFDWFHFTEELPGGNLADYQDIVDKYWQLLSARVSTTPIMLDNPDDMKRKTQVFERGNWLVKGDEVEADVPHALNPMPENAPKNRLGLAMWLTDKKNPLTARTMVNRLWEQLFGAGLVETLEDMGTQGAAPTHKELLDYLAYKYMNDFEWSTKKLLREMVLSATYRQDAKISKIALDKDPFNKLYGRSSRVRLTAEQVRDQALALSGLLSYKMYGPSVMPWQPDGIWQAPYNGQTWNTSAGEDQYRRSVYTYWKRTSPYPAMLTFDASPKDLCAARRISTNTPLQALVTLNDSVYVEAAKQFAFRIKPKSTGTDAVQQAISKGYELVMLKQISPARLTAFTKLYENALQKYKQDQQDALAITHGLPEHQNAETAALIVVANAMLNMDELITKN